MHCLPKALVLGAEGEKIRHVSSFVHKSSTARGVIGEAIFEDQNNSDLPAHPRYLNGGTRQRYRQVGRGLRWAGCREMVGQFIGV